MSSTFSFSNKKRKVDQCNSEKYEMKKKQKIQNEKDLEIIELKRAIDILQKKIYDLENNLRTKSKNYNTDFYSSYIS